MVHSFLELQFVLNFFWDFEARCSHKIVLIKKECEWAGTGDRVWAHGCDFDILKQKEILFFRIFPIKEILKSVLKNKEITSIWLLYLRLGSKSLPERIFLLAFPFLIIHVVLLHIDAGALSVAKWIKFWIKTTIIFFRQSSAILIKSALWTLNYF